MLNYSFNASRNVRFAEQHQPKNIHQSDKYPVMQKTCICVELTCDYWSHWVISGPMCFLEQLSLNTIGIRTIFVAVMTIQKWHHLRKNKWVSGNNIFQMSMMLHIPFWNFIYLEIVKTNLYPQLLPLYLSSERALPSKLNSKLP